ncbi:hypothetical protein FOA52_015726 [Chlamydomonas sp. UWO 241]|nr:hypothetical protein FOA52_015726 [Chlamydomonas sp. UWO 241]
MPRLGVDTTPEGRSRAGRRHRCRRHRRRRGAGALLAGGDPSPPADALTPPGRAINGAATEVQVVVNIVVDETTYTYGSAVALGAGVCAQLIRNGVFSACTASVKCAYVVTLTSSIVSTTEVVAGEILTTNDNQGIHVVVGVLKDWLDTNVLSAEIAVTCKPGSYNVTNVCTKCAACTTAPSISSSAPAPSISSSAPAPSISSSAPAPSISSSATREVTAG